MKKINAVCIIDDDRIFVSGIQRMMDIVDFSEQVIIKNNGEEAIDYFRTVFRNGENTPDLILLDINMPIMDGWEFLEEFQKIIPEDKKIPVYMVSSSVDPLDVQKAKSYKIVSDYLIKPMNTKVLKKLKELITDN